MMAYRFLLLAMLVAVSQPCLGRTDCPVAKVLHIQLEGSKIMVYQEGGPWRTLGYLNETGTKERYSAVLAAQYAGKGIMIGYARSDYNCSATNYGESAYIVRTFNQ